jgi:formiminoglutamase
MIDFYNLTRQDLIKLTSLRVGEIKLGEKVKSYDDFSTFKGKYVVVGVEESVGPEANLGFSGAEKGFQAFLSRFLNIQSNRFFSGDEVLFYGVFKVQTKDSLEEKRDQVVELDSLLVSHLLEIFKKDLIPILIGGGHNNAYPLMKAFNIAKQKKINVINCDPHADYRLLEGRHSGNSFSYAKNEGVLNYYKVIGLHQSYNSEEMLTRMEQEGCEFSFFDDYLLGQSSIAEDVHYFINKNKRASFGVELDMDAIIGLPASAFTYSGITVEDARKFILQLAKEKEVVYLHLPEGAPIGSREETIVGKTLAYLVSDFIKSNKSLKIKC